MRRSSLVRRPVCLVAGLASVLLFGVPSLAHAASGWPVASAEVLLAHDAAYSIAGTTRTHSGIDIRAEEGEAVVSASEGEVSFVGRVPGAGSETVLAVTVLSGDLKVTYSPLSAADVARGDSVATGDRLGSLATEGDPSSAETHVHVSMRRGEAYINPLCVLSQPSPAEAIEEAPTPEPEQRTEATPEDEVAPLRQPARPAEAAGRQAAPSPSAAPAHAGSGVTEPVMGLEGPTVPEAVVTADAEPVAPPSPAVTAASAPVREGIPGAAGSAAGSAIGHRVRQHALFGIGDSPVVGLRLPGLAESLLGGAASLLLRFGLGRSRQSVLAPVTAPAAVRVGR